MRVILIAMILFITGCTSVPVIPKWPAVDKELLKSCPELKTVPNNNEKLSVVLESVVDNYESYYSCRDKVEYWILWYRGQQKIWETLK